MKVTSAQYVAAGIMVLSLGFGFAEVLAEPDLTITSMSAPTNAARGATISVVHTTKNVGNTLAGLSSTRFYLCTNNFACGFVNQQSVAALGVGASKTLTNTAFGVPAGQALGTNWIVGVCGFNISQPTGNDTNSIPIVITP
jgi:hypothetical protein